jgi:hypothetical protein
LQFGQYLPQFVVYLAGDILAPPPRSLLRGVQGTP